MGMNHEFERHITRELGRRNSTGAKALTGLQETFNALVETGLVGELPIGGNEPDIFDADSYGSVRLSQLIRTAMEAKHLTQARLARSARVPQSLISNLLNDAPRNIRATSIHRLSVALGVGIIDMMNAAQVSRIQSDKPQELNSSG